MGGQDSESFAIPFLLSLRKVSREARNAGREPGCGRGCSNSSGEDVGKMLGGLGAPFATALGHSKTTNLCDKGPSEVVQLDSGRRQNDHVRGAELLAFSAIVDGGVGPDSELAFDFGV